MQTLIDPFELGHSTKAFSRSGERPHAPPVITVRNDFTGPRATLLDVDEITWVASSDDDDFLDEEVTLELDLDSELPRKVIAPRGRGARVWTSEE
ncbi:MAG: hypothetical protein ABI461_11320 [Polyangiaceae bacterium]